MRFSRISAIGLRYWYLVTTYPQRFIQIFVWGTFDIILWGLVTRYLNGTVAGSLNFTSLLLGALIFWQLITRLQQGFTTVFLEDSWTRNFLNLFGSPISISEYLCGLVLTSFTTTFVAFSFGATVAMLIFGLPFPPIGLPLIVVVAILVLFGISIGILSAALVLRLGPSAEWLVWPIATVIQPFVGVFYPLATLPHWMQTLALFLPPSYAFEGLRALFSGETVSPFLYLGLVLSAACVVAAAGLFVVIFKWGLRSGALARYSAESFS